MLYQQLGRDVRIFQHQKGNLKIAEAGCQRIINKIKCFISKDSTQMPFSASDLSCYESTNEMW